METGTFADIASILSLLNAHREQWDLAPLVGGDPAELAAELERVESIAEYGNNPFEGV